jgi:hypothetical protein
MMEPPECKIKTFPVNSPRPTNASTANINFPVYNGSKGSRGEADLPECIKKADNSDVFPLIKFARVL